MSVIIPYIRNFAVDIMRVVSVFVFMLLLFAGHGTWAQQSRETFGKNRIQYKNFEWRYLSSENFDVYYYGERRAIARDVIEFLEAEFDRITDIIGFPPYLKSKVFLYNSVSDLQQSNVGLNHNPYSMGGETEFIKPYVEVAHLGNLEEFKSELIYKVSDLMVNQMMFGGSLKDMFQNAVLMNLPEWFISGASLYVAYGWDEEMDNYVRQLVMDKRKRRSVTKLKGREAALFGQSVWNFIGEKYGKSSISNILNYSRVIRNEEKSIRITLGVDFRTLLVNWERFYMENANQVNQSYDAPPADNQFNKKNENNVTYSTVKISPDGNNLAYAENDRGRFVVKVHSLSSEKEITILRGGIRALNKQINYNIPLISWADENTLGVIGLKRGEYTFWLYDLNTRSKLPRQLDRFSNIRSLDFSSNGRLAVVSADQNGQNDLYLISSRRDRTQRLTNDFYDDLDPVFIPNTNRIVFSSNRPNDTINQQVRDLKEIKGNFNLFIYDLDTTKNVVGRLTNTVSKDYYPTPLDQTTIFYLSDQRGITNLFKYNLVTGIYSQVTNFSTSILQYDINQASKTLVTVNKDQQLQNIYVHKDFDFDRQVFTPSSRRQEYMNAKSLVERRRQETERTMSLRDLVNQRMRDAEQAAQDSIRKEQEKPIISEQVSVQIDTLITRRPEPEINTDNYVFEDEVVRRRTQQQSESFLSRYVSARDRSRITGPFPYEPRFSSENMMTSFVFDPLRGFGITLETQMNDILENYRFYGGVMATTDLRSGDIYAEFQYLKLPFDFGVRFDRNVIFWNGNRNFQKYALNKLEFTADFPITEELRFSFKPFGAYTRFADLGSNIIMPGPPQFFPKESIWYAGATAELVFDNSLATGLNIIEGSRGKIAARHFEGVGNSSESFTQFFIDLRHYQKIHKEITFAMRGYAGSFFGRAPKNYVLGGVNNWITDLNRNTNRRGTGNPLSRETESGFNSNLLFLDYATNLRGFNYATLYGNQVMLFNAELRFPIVKYFSTGSIASNFFRNMQFIGFYDIGSAWSGGSPFSTDNRISADIIKQGAFQAEIKNYINPWLYSYGIGMRTMMLGYYMRFDLAWPVENYTVKDPRLFVSLGFDF
ncbi:MAG TPA: translocation protein TolB [Cyclobacteriaceae bacterium]|nr:translocation protein TolB [Cyclobacteriaceae bacterium]